jgi:hypothetical protein
MAEQVLPEEDRLQPDPDSGWLWFGLLGAPVAWAVHFAACYSLIGVACAAGWDSYTLLGLNSVTALVLLSILVALPIAIASAIVARRAERRAASQPEVVAERDAYLGRAGMLAGAFFSLALLFEGLVLVVTPPCG